MSETPHTWIHEVRERLASPLPKRLVPSEERRAAVLVPLYVDAGEIWVVLTKRSDELPTHKGQVAFPGGGSESGEDAWQTALRETEEEIGVVGEKVLRLGQLDEASTPSGFQIIPCVGAVPYPLETTANPEEIVEVFSIPLLAFTETKVVENRSVRIDGEERLLRVYHVGRHQVWGLTARIVQNLLQRLDLEVDESIFS
jgi:8-oxo-dGTP pyrophosphatase MutT (NUDIX family)